MSASPAPITLPPTLSGLRLVGRTRSLISLPNGMNVHPEDVDAALTEEGLVEPVVYEAEPGKIAMTYRAGAAFTDPVPDEPAAVAAAVKAANRKLARISGWSRSARSRSRTSPRPTPARRSAARSRSGCGRLPSSWPRLWATRPQHLEHEHQH